MARVIFDNVTKLYSGGVIGVYHLSMEVEDQEFLVLVGPSGCGKSTAMRMVAGLEEISEGRIIIGDRVVNDLPPKDRDVAMVFQSYALYPHMTVCDNLAYPLKLRKVPKAERDQRVREAARMLDIEQLLDRKPKALSGGQRQRVALGRAIVRNADVFLMDEPLSNLDAKLRVQTRAELIKLHERVSTTTIYVTHDQVEAMTMGDRIAVHEPRRPAAARHAAEPVRHPGQQVRCRLHRLAVDELHRCHAREAWRASLRRQPRLLRMRVPEWKDGFWPSTSARRSPWAFARSTCCRGIRLRNCPEDSKIPVTVDVVELLGNEIFVYLTDNGATITARMPPDSARARPENGSDGSAELASLLRPETDNGIYV